MYGCDVVNMQEHQSDDAVPDWAHGSFAAIVLEYVASLNQRPEQPMIREHEFDTLAATLALCCDTALPGAPLGRASAQVQQRMYQVKELLYNHITTHFHANSEIRLPPRGASVATYFQTAAHLLMDIARLLWLDADFGHGSMVFLPEPREIFSAQIFAALYLAGAYESWELSFPEGDSAWQWEEIMNQLVELRHEVLWCQPFRTWREELLWSLRPGVIAWPTERQLDEERKKSSHVEELPIDEHRDKILKHIESHRVTPATPACQLEIGWVVVLCVWEAKKHQFPWETNDGMFVMGPIGDMLLKKLKEKDVTPTADPRSYSTKSFCSTPVSPSTALRRGKCKIAGSRCKRYNPRLFIPQSLMDGLEIANELKSAANKLLEEAADEVPYGIEESGEGEATGRREILPGIAPHDLAFELEEPIPNGAPVFTKPGRIARFRIKEERWNREILTAGTESVKGVLKRLSASEFACNMQLLGELREWCDGYRAIKAKRMAQKAFQFAEDRELALQRRSRSAKRSDQPELVERGQLRAKKLGELAAKDVEHTIDSALEICHCGYQEIWHEGPVSFEVPRVPQRRNSRRLSISRSPLEAMAPAHVCCSETSPSPALICTATRQSCEEWGMELLSLCFDIDR
ncbi:rha-1 [Symbiodinium sp. CCMP2456]|nr:rha-1 [Symbiodinium sp. CCMP2456]